MAMKHGWMNKYGKKVLKVFEMNLMEKIVWIKIKIKNKEILENVEEKCIFKIDTVKCVGHTALNIYFSKFPCILIKKKCPFI